MAERGNLADMRERLKSNKLSKDDLRYLDGLLATTESSGAGGTSTGKRIVARLPNGMDLVK